MFHDEEYQRKRRERDDRLRNGSSRKKDAGQGYRDRSDNRAEADAYKRPTEAERADGDYGAQDHDTYRNSDGAEDTDREVFDEDAPLVRRNPEREKRDEYLRRLDGSRRGSGQEDHMRSDERDTSHEEDDLDPMHYGADDNRYADSGGQNRNEQTAERRPKGSRSSAASGKKIVGETAGFIKGSGTATKVMAAVIAGLVLLLMILGIIFIVNFFRDRANAQLTPRATAQELLESLREDDYDRYLALFPGEGTQESFADRTTFEGLKNGLHQDALTTDYILIRQGNGRDILIAMEFDEEADAYEIYDVRIVPDDDKGMFVY